MAKRLVCIVCIFLLVPAASILCKTVLLKNASLYLPAGKVLNDAYLLISGAKIGRIGSMKELKPEVVDEEYDLKGLWVYPAFIDAYYPGFQEKPRTAEAAPPGGRAERAIDKNIRKPFSERNYFFDRRLVDLIKLNRSEANRIIGGGFAVVQVVPDSGIVGGETVTVSLVSDSLRESVLNPSGFLHLAFNANRNAYPMTPSAILAEMKQLKADASYYRDARRLWSLDPEKRPEYTPELEYLQPYFQGDRRFLLQTRHMGEQRLAEFFLREVASNPVLVLSSDCWRRQVDNRLDLILPLGFKPPAASIYANQGDRIKKQAEEKLYPEKIAAFVKTNARLILSAPEKGDYRTLFANIRILVKNGVPENQVIEALTVNPARLLRISAWTGALEPGKLANLLVTDGPVFAEKTKIKKVWVEGSLTDLAAQQRAAEPPAANLAGRWVVKVQSQMGTFDMSMTLEQEGNILTGKLTSQMGTMEIQDGFISGKRVSFSLSANIMGQQMQMSFNGTVEDRRIEGKLSLGEMGEATLTAIPESTGTGGEQ